MKITKEWLEANGWRIHVLKIQDWFFATKIQEGNMLQWSERKGLSIYRNYQKGDIYPHCLIDNVTTVERLQEALAFCGIRGV